MRDRLLAAVLGLSAAPSLLAGQVASPEPLVVGETFTIDSRVLDETRPITAYAPAVYADSPDLRPPVPYMSDGGIGVR